MIARDFSVTVRLSAQERDELSRLQERYSLNQSDVIRKLLSMANNPRYRLPQAGQFVAAHGRDVIFPVELGGDDGE